MSESKRQKGENSEKAVQVTQILSSWSLASEGDRRRAIEVLYNKLHSRAEQLIFARASSDEIDPTVLVNETYIRLFGSKTASWESRQHFLYAATKVMRHTIVDHFRHEHAGKRNVQLKTPFTDSRFGQASPFAELYDIEVALRELEAINPDYGRIVEARFFAGLTIGETAHVLGMSVSTVKRKSAAAEVWLHERLS